MDARIKSGHDDNGWMSSSRPIKIVPPIIDVGRQRHREIRESIELLVASDDRAPLAPDVPTARQAGFPTLSLFGGHGLFAPKEIPDELRARIADDLRAILTDAEVARRLTTIGYIPRTESTAEFAAILDRERLRWTEVARMYGAKPPQ